MSVGARALGIARPLLPAFPELPAEERRQAERELEAFLAAQLSEMPRYLKPPFRVALVAFDWLPLLRFGRTYSALPLDTQRRVVAFWSDAPLAPMRNFVKLLRTCALFAWLDHPMVAARLEAEAEPPLLEAGGAGAD